MKAEAWYPTNCGHVAVERIEKRLTEYWSILPLAWLDPPCKSYLCSCSFVVDTKLTALTKWILFQDGPETCRFASNMMIRQSMFSSRAKAPKGIKDCVTFSIRRCVLNTTPSFPRPSSSLQAPRTVRHSCCFSKPVLCMRRARIGKLRQLITPMEVTRLHPWKGHVLNIQKGRAWRNLSLRSFHFLTLEILCQFSSLPGAVTEFWKALHLNAIVSDVSV